MVILVDSGVYEGGGVAATRRTLPMQMDYPIGNRDTEELLLKSPVLSSVTDGGRSIPYCELSAGRSEHKEPIVGRRLVLHEPRGFHGWRPTVGPWIALLPDSSCIGHGPT